MGEVVAGDLGESVVLALRNGAVVFLTSGLRELVEEKPEGLGDVGGKQAFEAVHPVQQPRDADATAGEPFLFGVGGALHPARHQQRLDLVGELVGGHLLGEFEQRGLDDLGERRGGGAQRAQDDVGVLDGEFGFAQAGVDTRVERQAGCEPAQPGRFTGVEVLLFDQPRPSCPTGLGDRRLFCIDDLNAVQDRRTQLLTQLDQVLDLAQLRGR